MFKQYPSNDRQRKYQCYATRLYILLIFISLTILTFYSSLISTIHQETVLNPSETQYINLQKVYTDTLSCPCKTSVIPYYNFITIQPHYHQVCSSDMVSQRWIEYLKIRDPTYDSNTIGANFKYHASLQFHLLAELCRQTQQTNNDALPFFLETQFVSSQVIFENLFTSEVNLSIENWKLSTTNQFLRTIRLFQSIIQGNQLTNGILNIYWDFDPLTYATEMESKMYGNCSCGLSPSCLTSMGMYEYNSTINALTEVFRIPNFFVDCSSLQGLLSSTLECYYNQSCMLQIGEHLDYSTELILHFSILNSSLNMPNETIETILTRLMIDFWLTNISFSSYFSTCAPLSCTFEYTGRNDFIVIATTIISIFGGLSLGYKLFIMITLQLIEKIRNGMSCVRLIQLIKNLFICHDEHQTIDRLHVLFVLTSLCVLCSFTSFIPRTIVVQIQKPTLDTYHNLIRQFPDSVQCPCSEISIPQNAFLTIQPRFHRVCSSDFVTNDWISHLFNQSNLTDQVVPSDFRTSAGRQFQMLASFCQLSQETGNTMSAQFVANHIVTDQILSPNSFQQLIQININQFKKTMPNSFLSTLSLIRQMTGSNMLTSVLSTSWIYIAPEFYSPGDATNTRALIYDECNCGMSMKCVQASGNMLKGCYLLEALMQWSLQCLYDQQCIDPSATFKAMNKSDSATNRITTNATVESMINQLMIEDYLVNMSYEKYFTKCLPSSCKYSYIDKVNFIDGLTNLIAFYAGVVIICRVIAVMVVKIFRRPTTRVIPIMN